MNNVKFKDLNLSNSVQMAIDSIGYEEATPIQAESIPHIMEGKDVTGLAQTGTGKTFAFGIPAIEKLDLNSKDVQVLVLCPTRELAIQTCEGLKQLTKYTEEAKIIPIYGGQQIDRQIAALKKNPQIVVGTPGRVMDHMRRKTLKLANVSMFILDEADEMLNMGFREDIDTILKQAPENRQIILFSATMSKGIMDITAKYQKKDAVKIKISHVELVTPNIEQYYLEVSEASKADVLTRLLDSMNIKLAVVFCNTKRKVDDVTLHLQASGYMVEALHGDIRQSQRDVIMRKFRKGDIDILVATDVAARGIDIDDIDVVFNYDIPSDEEYYVHRIGRTGRAGRFGKAYTFVVGREIYKLKDIQKYAKANINLYKAPSYEDVLDKKIMQKVQKIKADLEKGNISKYVNIVEKIIAEENMTSLDIAAVLLKLEFEKANKTISSSDTDKKDGKSRSRNINSEGIINGNITRMFVNMGKLDGFDTGAMRDMLIDDLKVPKNSISDIKVLDKFSFVNIDKEYVDQVLKNMNGKEYNGRDLNLEVSGSSRENGGKREDKRRGNKSMFSDKKDNRRKSPENFKRKRK
ncbi:MAG: DEAD/DEAH box helicase [Clostridia bacterium]|nr:DEAD/DEAH box helicase [Clostridia bacterium]